MYHRTQTAEVKSLRVIRKKRMQELRCLQVLPCTSTRRGRVTRPVVGGMRPSWPRKPQGLREAQVIWNCTRSVRHRHLRRETPADVLCHISNCADGQDFRSEHCPVVLAAPEFVSQAGRTPDYALANNGQHPAINWQLDNQTKTILSCHAHQGYRVLFHSLWHV